MKVLLKKKNKINDVIFVYGLILVVLTLPFSFAANSILIAFLSINWLVEANYYEKFKLLKNNLLLCIFIFYFLLHITGLFINSNTHIALSELQKKTPLLALPIIIATSRKLNSKEINKILKAFLFSILIASFICIGYAIYRTDFIHTFSIYWLHFSYSDLTNIIKIQHTYLAAFTCFSLFILLYFFIKNFKTYNLSKKIAFILLNIYLIFFLFLLASRTAIAAFIFVSFSVIMLYFYLNKKTITGVLILFIVSTFIGIIGYENPFIKERFFFTFGIEQHLNWINQYGDGHSDPQEDRKIIWKSVWNAGKENWLFGAGTGNVEDKLLQEYARINFKAGYDAQYNAHSQYLQTWLELGLIGLISLLVCFIYPLIIAWRKKNMLFVSFLCLIIISCITESMLERQHGIVFYSLFTSIFSFHSINKDEKL